jgi:nitrogen regulatory protein P-II 1
LSIVVSDSFVDATVDAIIKSGATGNVGDGKIFILPCEEAYRIRTGEKGNKSFN